VIWVLIAVLIIAVVVLAALLMRSRRSQRLQEDFGPEYDRAVEERGDRRQAEAELADRRERREQLDIRPLDPGARERYAERWHAAQRRFVDKPAEAVGEADALVSAVMSERGYPVSDEFDQRASDISVDHPVVVEHYRAAHEISLRTTAGDASTEDLRQAMVHFRALFDELLGREERTDREERTVREEREPTHATKERT
jgi:predicted nucleic acid-binding protein